MKVLFLASRSPQRLALIQQLGLPVQVIEHQVQELDDASSTDFDATRIVLANALQKAESVVDQVDDGLIIAGDTLIVTREGQILGQPQTSNRALKMLQTLVGNWHQVVTALAIVDARTGKHGVGYNSAKVWFRDVSEESVRRYVATGEPLNKAGGYAIQGRGGFFVSRVEGSYTAVVGLPIELLIDLLETHGVSIWDYW